MVYRLLRLKQIHSQGRLPPNPYWRVSRELVQWLEEISQYDMDIIHRKGKLHQNADSLSRIPDELEFCDCYRAGVDLDQLPCGGCSYCSRANKQWSTFKEQVDYVVQSGRIYLAPSVFGHFA